MCIRDRYCTPVPVGIPDEGLPAELSDAAYYEDVRDLLDHLYIVFRAETNARPQRRAKQLALLESLLLVSSEGNGTRQQESREEREALAIEQRDAFAA